MLNKYLELGTKSNLTLFEAKIDFMAKIDYIAEAWNA